MMRKALVRRGFALAILMAFVLVMGAGCCDTCKKYVDEAKMYADQAKASASKADKGRGLSVKEDAEVRACARFAKA